MNIKSGLWLMTLVLCATTQTMAQTTNDGFGAYPPAPKAEPLTETLHGVKISDPYRWMESPDRSEEMVAWVKASSAQTTSTLAKLPGRAPLLKALEDASRVGAVHSNVKLAGGRMFFLELASDANIPVLKVRENGSDRLFLDPMVGAPAGGHRTINNYMPSPDGKLVAIHTADGGGEVGATRFYDVVTHKVLDDVLTPIWGEFTVNWLDDKTVTYTRMNLAERQEDAMENMTVFVHHLGTPMSSDGAVEGSKVGAGFPMSTVEFPIVRTRQRSHWADRGVSQCARG